MAVLCKACKAATNLHHSRSTVSRHTVRHKPRTAQQAASPGQQHNRHCSSADTHCTTTANTAQNAALIASHASLTSVPKVLNCSQKPSRVPLHVRLVNCRSCANCKSNISMPSTGWFTTSVCSPVS
jgi:hypothetical protein